MTNSSYSAHSTDFLLFVVVLKDEVISQGNNKREKSVESTESGKRKGETTCKSQRKS